MTSIPSNGTTSPGPDKPKVLLMDQKSWTDTKSENPKEKIRSTPEKIEDSYSRIPTTEKLTIVTKSFVGNTMPQILLTSSALMSFVWVVFYLFFITVLTFQATLTFKDYYSHPVNVEVTIETGSHSLEFPAVTLCNNNIVKKSSISRIPKYKELASLSDFVYQQILPESNRDRGQLENLGFHECYSEPSKWIPGSWVCNGRQDCSGGSDEGQCSSYQRLNYSQNCLESYVECPSESTCASTCDGVRDCIVVSGYDESEDFGCTSIYGVTNLTAETLPKTLNSPNYPNLYMNNLEKTYVIEALENHVIKLTFNRFFVEKCYNCWCDALAIQEGGPDDYGSMFRFGGNYGMCGQMCEFGDIVSQTNKLTLWFITDVEGTRDGWSLNYVAIPKEDAQPHPGYAITYTKSCGYTISSNTESSGSSDTPPDATPYWSYETDEKLDPETSVGNSEFAQFDNIAKYDWYSVYQNSIMPDFSDFKKFIRFEQEELVGNAHQKEDFVVQCVFDGEVCGASSFQTFQHVSFGNCFSFNSIVGAQGGSSQISEARVTSKVGTENGLALSLFLENDEYLGVIGHKTGVRVVLHNSDEYPPLLTKGMQVNAGTATTISIRQQTVVRESDPFSDCAEEWPEFLELNANYKKYRFTLEFCEYLCRQKTLAEQCGCTDTFDWNFSDISEIQGRAKKNCDVWNGVEYNCLTSVYADFSKGRRSCDCPNSCADKSFRATASSASWPSASYTAHFISLMKNSNSSKVKKFINTALEEAYSDEFAKGILQKRIEENFARVEISFETTVYQKIKESPKYNLSSLFGTIGGNLGLWLGWSILSLLEFLQWIGMSIGLFFMDRKKKARVTDARNDEKPYL